jgi:hypothetical protein
MDVSIFVNGPELDENGLYFWKITQDDNRKVVKREKVRPEEIGFQKTFTREIYVHKTIVSTESIANEVVWFSMTLTYTVPNEARYKYYYLYKVRSGEIFFKDFSGQPCPCAKIEANDPEFVTRSREKKLPQNSILKKGIPVFEYDPTTGELRREVTASEPYSTLI